MRRFNARIRSESGQVFVFVAVIMVALVGMAALVIDVGSWFHAQRKLQTAADAAALAGAQHLPTDLSQARDVALAYAQHNDAGIPAPTVTFPDPATIQVAARADTPGIFAPVLNSAFGIVTVHAQAQARVFAPEKLKNVAPIGLSKDKACIVLDPSCFGKPVDMTFSEEDDPTKSKFGLLDLDRSGSAGAGDMKDWLENGYPDYLPINTYYPPANGEKNGIKKELEDAADEQRTLLFPVFDPDKSISAYYVIGWAAFVIDDVVAWTGHDHRLKGHFVTFIATDLAAGNPITDPSNDFGVHVITLTQ
jgi:hypothetical protein